MRWTILALLVALVACDDTLFGVPRDAAPRDSAALDGWCGVQSFFNQHCTGCHGVGGQAGLDLSTTPHAAIVGVESSIAGRTLVVPGDPEASLLLRKIEGTQAADEGDPMPPGTLQDASVVRSWIADGAPGDCDGPVDSAAGSYHPAGWAEPEMHGQEAKLQSQPCVNCHGETLEGEIGPSCDSCHVEGWRTTCTFCHGGEETQTGAPPREIAPGAASFRPHTLHTTESARGPAFDCTTCHTKPEDVLSQGHVFLGDQTPGEAEVDFSDGLSVQGVYSGTCSSLYCHGDRGRHNGSVEHTEALSCDGCHPDQGSGRDAWDARMSGEHEDHLRRGVQCADCHGAVVSAGQKILDVTLHVNGRADLELPISRSNGRCTGTCHGEDHRDESW